MKAGVLQPQVTPSQLIDARIEELGDGRGEVLGHLRSLMGEGEAIDGDALKMLIRAAVARNQSRAKR